jgi:hypothetical protein
MNDIVQEARWAPEPLWTSVENLASSGIRSPDRVVVLYTVFTSALSQAKQSVCRQNIFQTGVIDKRSENKQYFKSLAPEFSFKF